MATNQALTKGNVAQMKDLIASENVKARMNEMLGDSSGTFLASVLDLYTSDSALRRCDAAKVLAECMKAASLKLPVSRALGFAYIIPYGNVPNFQLGYRGIIQLAQRSGQYRYINADCIYEGETPCYNRLTGVLEIKGEAVSDKPIGYFAYFQLLNGFEKAIFWSREKVEAHAKRYSKAWSKADSPWHLNFDTMAFKTVLKQLISKYGPMSIEMGNAMASDSVDDRIEAEIVEDANGEPIEIPDNVNTRQMAEAPKQEPVLQNAEIADDEMEPGF